MSFEDKISLTDMSMLTIEMEESGGDPIAPIIDNSEQAESTNREEMKVNLDSGRN